MKAFEFFILLGGFVNYKHQTNVFYSWRGDNVKDSIISPNFNHVEEES